MKSLILTIAFIFVSLFTINAQTSTGKTIKIANEQREVFMGARGGMYAVSSTGAKTYLNEAQKASLGLTASTSTTVVSVPTAAQTAVAKKSPVLVDNGDTAVYYGVTFQVETGSRGGRYIVVEKNGEVKKVYLSAR